MEIKGRCPVIVWGSRRGDVANYKAGTLAKIPRNALRFEELKNTTKVTVAELRSLLLKPLPEIVPIIKMEIVLCGRPTIATAPEVDSSNSNVKASIPKVRAVGSCSEKAITEQELQKLGGLYLQVATTLLGTHPIKTGRVVATVMDLAIFLMLLKWFNAHMNEDGSLPYARFKGLWDALYKAKDIDRAFDPKRFAILRNYVSSLGLLEWTDATYKQGHWERGVRVDGVACKWKASDVLMSMLHEEQRQKKTTLAGTSASSSLQESVESLHRLPFEQTIRPIEIVLLAFLHPTEEEMREAMGLAV